MKRKHAMMGTMTLAVVLLQTAVPAQAQSTYVSFEGVVTWSWFDDSRPFVKQFQDVVLIDAYLSCTGEKQCAGRVLIDGSLGEAHCYIKPGQSFWDGHIKIGTHLESCRDVSQFQTADFMFGKCHGALTLAGDVRYTFGGAGGGQGDCP